MSLAFHNRPACRSLSQLKSSALPERHTARPGGNRPRTHPSPRPAVQNPLRAQRRTDGELLSRDIHHLALRLEVIHRTAVTVQMALRHQDAENDDDFAECMRYGVCDPLSDQVQRAHVLAERVRIELSRPASSGAEKGGRGPKGRRS